MAIKIKNHQLFEVAKYILVLEPDITNRELGRRLGVHHTTAKTYKKFAKQPVIIRDKLTEREFKIYKKNKEVIQSIRNIHSDKLFLTDRELGRKLGIHHSTAKTYRKIAMSLPEQTTEKVRLIEKISIEKHHNIAKRFHQNSSEYSKKQILEHWKSTPELSQYIDWDMIDNNKVFCFTCYRYYEKGECNIDRHHIHPLYMSGKDDLSNLVLLCEDCHREAPEDPDLFWLWLKHCDEYHPEITKLFSKANYLIQEFIKNNIDFSKITFDEIKNSLKISNFNMGLFLSLIIEKYGLKEVMQND